MSGRKILISGAGIGGLTLAYFLQRNGDNPVVIEKSESLRTGGYMIDFFSSGITVAEKMGILEQLQEKDRGSNIIHQQDKQGRDKHSLDLGSFREHVDGKFFNFLRSELVDILYAKVRDNVNIRFGKTIERIHQHPTHVRVVFSDGVEQTFDLVIGADGVHSNVRDKVYPSKSIERTFLGYYLCIVEHDVKMDVAPKEIKTMLAPGRQVMTYTLGDDRNTSIFIFKSDKQRKLNNQRPQRLLEREFETFNGTVRKVIAKAKGESKVFFDEVTQIRIHDNWHKNRVALIGDAAFCITLLSGQGASMAMTSAYVLSEQLKHNDHLQAFENYERNLRPMIEKMQEKAKRNASSYVPSTGLKLFVRNLVAPLIFTKAFAPLLVRQLGATNYFDMKGGKKPWQL